MTMIHLAEKIIQFYEEPDDFRLWLEKMHGAGVIHTVEFNGDIIRISGMVNTAVWRKTDPINNLVCLALAFYGPFWAFMSDADAAFKKVNKWWRSQIKKTRPAGKLKKQRTLEDSEG